MEYAAGGRVREVVGRARRAAHVAALLAGTALIAWLVLWAAYGFRHALSPDPAARSAGRALLDDPGEGALRALLVRAAAWRLVPEDYARGFVFVLRHSEARPAFLLGELSERGFPHYFLATFALKTPLPLVALLVLALAGAPSLPSRLRLVLWLPVAVYVAASLGRGIQIGHRHLLPIYPFLFVAAGRAALLVEGRRRVAAGAAVAALAGWYAAGTLRQHPHHLAFFNELAGGASNGWRLLADSNLDWGQELKALKAWMDERGVARIKLSYFGSADPGYYGIECDMLPSAMSPRPPRVTRTLVPGDVVAVSVTNLQGVYLDPEDRRLMERLRALEPIGRVGYSIRVYRADFHWPPS
jgi:hypothetical protein